MRLLQYRRDYLASETRHLTVLEHAYRTGEPVRNEREQIRYKLRVNELKAEHFKQARLQAVQLAESLPRLR